MNPPFPADNDPKTRVSRFVNRGFEGLKDGGTLVAIVPDGVLHGDTVRAAAVGIISSFAAHPWSLPNRTRSGGARR